MRFGGFDLAGKVFWGFRRVLNQPVIGGARLRLADKRQSLNDKCWHRNTRVLGLKEENINRLGERLS